MECTSLSSVLVAAHKYFFLVREVVMCHCNGATIKCNEDLGKRRCKLWDVTVQVGKIEALFTCTVTSISVRFV